MRTPFRSPFTEADALAAGAPPIHLLLLDLCGMLAHALIRPRSQ